MADNDNDIPGETEPVEINKEDDTEDPKEEIPEGPPEIDGETNAEGGEEEEAPGPGEESEGKESKEAEDEEGPATVTDIDAAAEDEGVAVEDNAEGEPPTEEPDTPPQPDENEPDENEPEENEPEEKEPDEKETNENEVNKDDEITEVNHKNYTDATEEMTPEDKAECRRIFEKKAVNGRLDLTGLKAVFRLMGEVVTSSDADRIFQEADTDDNDTLDFDEFCRLYSRHGQTEESRRALLLDSLKKLFPSDGSDQVDLKKVEQVLLRLQDPAMAGGLAREKSELSHSDIKSLVRSMDKDGNGMISSTEFVNTLCQRFEG